MFKGKYLDYNIGQKHYNSVVDALHAASPKADMHTGEIVGLIIEKIDASGIISKVSRSKMDLNRPIDVHNRLGILEYRKFLQYIVISKGILIQHNRISKRFLHISVHGMDKSKHTDFEIGTRNGTSCCEEIKDWFCKRLEIISPNIGINNIFPGDPSKAYHRHGDPDNDYAGYGDNFNTIQFEISHYFRNKGIDSVVDFLCNTILDFEFTFNN
jgi:hypothetical protein